MLACIINLELFLEMLYDLKICLRRKGRTLADRLFAKTGHIIENICMPYLELLQRLTKSQ